MDRVRGDSRCTDLAGTDRTANEGIQQKGLSGQRGEWWWWKRSTGRGGWEVEIRDVVGCWRKRKQKGKKIRQIGLVALCLSLGCYWPEYLGQRGGEWLWLAPGGCLA